VRIKRFFQWRRQKTRPKQENIHLIKGHAKTAEKPDLCHAAGRARPEDAQVGVRTKIRVVADGER